MIYIFDRHETITITKENNCSLNSNNDFKDYATREEFIGENAVDCKVTDIQKGMVLDFVEPCEIEICESLDESHVNEERIALENPRSNDENDNNISNEPIASNSKKKLNKRTQILKRNRLKSDGISAKKVQLKCLYCDYIASDRKDYSRHRLESHPKSQLRFPITNNITR